MKIEINIDDKFLQKIKAMFTKNRLIIGFFSLVMAGSIIVYAAEPLDLEHIFVEGEVISAQQVNANFAALQNKINELNAEIQELQTALDTSGETDPLPDAVPPGTIIPYAGHIELDAEQSDYKLPPEGWLLCDGSLLEVNTENEYFALFQAIGTRWGGNGSTFMLPDLRGRFLRGVANGELTDPDRNIRTNLDESAILGDVVGSYQLDAFQGHYHRFNEGVRDGGADSNNAARITLGADREKVFEPINGGHGDPRVSDETRPVNAAVHYIIKY